MTDLELVGQAQGGKGAAFHELVDRHARRLYGLALRLIGNSADAEDVVQETFVGAFLRLREFRRQASVRTWLTQILLRQAARHYRRQRRRQVLPLGQYEPAPRAPSAQTRAETRLDLGRAILALAPEHREVIVLRELQGLSYDEIASALGLPRGTVESRLFRARRQMQEILKDYRP